MDKQVIFTDIAILGGGASGLAAACAIGQSGYKGKTLLIERHARVGKKLLATGNGRCNLTNTHLTPAAFHGSCAKQGLVLFQTYDSAYMKQYFNTLGLLTKAEENGLVYPYSNSANSVLDVFRLQLSKYAIEQVCGTHIQEIVRTKQGYRLISEETAIETKKLIMTCGGKAAAKLSSDGSGYTLLKELGYKLAPLYPSLAPVKVDSPVLRSLKGLRVKCMASLLADGKPIKQEQGEVQFGDGTLSGICMFQLSPFVNAFFTSRTVMGKPIKQLEIALDLCPDYTQQEVEQLLLNKAGQFPGESIEALFTGIFVKRVGQALLKSCGLTEFNRTMGTLNRKEIKNLAYRVKHWVFTPKCISDFAQAQITAGGVRADDLCFSTMESAKDKQLYFAGELVDIDGLCGGYNLHWAWVSGMIAGKSAATEKEQK